MVDKKIIITEDSIRLQPKVDLQVDGKEVLNKREIKQPNSMIYDMYQKYQNICLEKNHVLTLRRGK